MTRGVVLEYLVHYTQTVVSSLDLESPSFVLLMILLIISVSCNFKTDICFISRMKESLGGRLV